MEVKFITVTHVTGKSSAYLKHYNSPPSPKLSILKIPSIQAYYKKKIGLIYMLLDDKCCSRYLEEKVF